MSEVSKYLEIKFKTFLYNQWFKEDVQKNTKIYFELDKNKHANLWVAANTMISSKFIELKICTKREGNQWAQLPP